MNKIEQPSKDIRKKLSKETLDLPKYPRKVYISNLKHVLMEDNTDEVDFWTILGKKGRLVVSKGTEEGNLSTSKSFGKLLKESKSDIFSALDISSEADYSNPTYARNPMLNFSKKIGDALVQDFDIQSLYDGLPDFGTDVPEEKIYMGIITAADKAGYTICIGKNKGKFLNYHISNEDATFFGSKIKLNRGHTAFVDIKDNKASLSSRSAFNKPREEFLKKMGIEMGGYKPIFYMTKTGKTFKGKVIGFGDDITGKQIIFQTKEGKKFPLSIDNLQRGMDFARDHYKKTHQKKLVLQKKPAPLLVKKPLAKEDTVKEPELV